MAVTAAGVDPTSAAGFTEAVAGVSTAVVVEEVFMGAEADSVAIAAERIDEAAPTAARGLSEREVRIAAEALAEGRRADTGRAEVRMADSVRRAA
jgi:hypothetical protein